MEKKIDKNSFDQMLTDVGKHFASPQALVDDQTLTKPQKLKLIEQWDYDMQLLLTASDENMPSPDGSQSGKVATTIAELRKALTDLGTPHDPEAAGPGKVAAAVVETPRRTGT